MWVKGNLVDGGGNGSAYIYVTSGSLKVGGTLGQRHPAPQMTLTTATFTFDLAGAPNPTTPLWQVGSLPLPLR